MCTSNRYLTNSIYFYLIGEFKISSESECSAACGAGVREVTYAKCYEVFDQSSTNKKTKTPVCDNPRRELETCYERDCPGNILTFY